MGIKMKYVKLKSDNIEDLVNEFIKTDKFYKYKKSKEDFYGSCDGVSTDLFHFLKDKNIDVKLISGTNPMFELDEDFFNHYSVDESEKEDYKKHIIHVVCLVGNQVIDLTFMQFDGKSKIRIIPLSKFKKEWKIVKPFKPFY